MDNPDELTSLTIPNNTTSQYKPKNIPIESILELAEKGLSHAQIAKMLDCDRSNISRRLSDHQIAIQGLKYHKKNRADIIALKGKKILENITDDKIKKMSGDRLVWSYGVLYDKERTELDKSNFNVANIHQITVNIEENEKELRRLDEELES